MMILQKPVLSADQVALSRLFQKAIEFCSLLFVQVIAPLLALGIGVENSLP